MSMTLILWKAPVVREAEEAEALLKPFHDNEDDGGFEASLDIRFVADELRRLYPWRELSNEETVAGMSEEERGRYDPDELKKVRGVEGGEPWSDLPFHVTDRLLVLDIKWKADDAVLDDITRLAREKRLLIYDPQGPDVHWPDDPVDTGPIPPPTLSDHLRGIAIALLFVALTYAAWLISIGWLRWPAVAIAAFIAAAALFVVYLGFAAPRDEQG